MSVEGDELRASARELRASMHRLCETCETMQDALRLVRDAEGFLLEGQPLLALQAMRRANDLMPSESVH